MSIAINKVVNVTINTSPTFPARKGFGLLLLIGSTISPLTPQAPIRFYSDIDGVGVDFNSLTPEYQAAQVYFSQDPKPKEIAIGLSQAAPASAVVLPATIAAGLAADVASVATFNAVTAGTLTLGINGSFVTATALNFSADATLAEVAARLQAAAGFAGVVTFTAAAGIITVTTIATGATASLTAPASPLGSSIVELLGLAGLSSQGVSIGSGFPLTDALNSLQNFNTAWYGFTFVNSPSEALITEAALWAEARVKIFGFTSANPDFADIGSVANTALTLSSMNLKRTFCIFDDDDTWAAVSVFGRAFTVNFNNQNSTLTLKFKQLPTITPLVITETQRTTLVARHINYYTLFGDSAMLAEGVMIGGRFFDEVHGLDWLQNAVENNVFGYMLTAKTKVPQTDAGTARLVQQVIKACKEAVYNGLIAPGTYNGPDLGAVESGDFLGTGYYVFAQKMADQNQADREARKSPPIQGILKGAGALHFADIELNFER